ncbi:MAG: ATP-binding protein [Eggerthellaceae bacterium]|nr:ATP-binding protein [Eggerthellaceae bacterium]
MISAMDVERKAIELLRNSETHNESSVLEYKAVPHIIKKEKTELIRDVLALLNGLDRPDEDRWLIYGVDNKTHIPIGIDIDNHDLLDDASYQQIIEECITPRPQFEFRTIDASFVIDIPFGKKRFGVFYFPETNNGGVYEVSKDFSDKEPKNNSQPRGRLTCGQSFIKIGSSKRGLKETERQRLRTVITQKDRKIIISLNENDVPEATMIIGRWDESNLYDVAAIEKASGSDYSRVVKSLKEIASTNPQVIDIQNQVWSIVDRKRVPIALYQTMTTRDLLRYKDLFIEILANIKARIEQDGERSILTNYGGIDSSYSREIRLGVAESCAFIANNKDLLARCNMDDITRFVGEIIWSIIGNSDWRVLASSEVAFPLLAEASPNGYLSAIDRSLAEGKALQTYLESEESGLVQMRRGHELFSGIALAARNSRHLSHAVKTLIALLDYSPYAKEILIKILLPWKPQTSASVEQRKGCGIALARNPSEATWEVLRALFPNATQSTSYSPDPKYLPADSMPEEVPMGEYWEVSKSYLNSALLKASGNPKRIHSLAHDALSFASAGMLGKLASFIAAECSRMDADSVFPIWDEVKLFLDHHEKYADANWALSKEELQPLIDVEAELRPSDGSLVARRLFYRDEFDYCFSKDYSDNRAELDKRRRESLEEVYARDGFDGLVELASTSEHPYLVGAISAQCSFSSTVWFVMVEHFLAGNIDKRIAQGFFRGKYAKEGSGFLENLDLLYWDNKSKAFLFSSLPNNEEVWGLAEKELAGSKQQYWELAEPAFDIQDKKAAHHYVTEMNEVGRHNDSILCLHEMLKKDVCLDSDLVFQTLMGFTPQEGKNQSALYFTDELIQYLEANNYDEGCLIELEVCYYSRIRNRKDAFLFKKLAQDADFFVDFITQLFDSFSSSADDDKTKAYKDMYWSFMLFGDWQFQPGSTDDGGIDTQEFNAWVSTIEKQIPNKELGRVSELIGKNLFYSPSDESGLFIAEVYAKYLESHPRALDGYSVEVVNSRGVHFVDASGKQEEEIAAGYDNKAEELEARGYVNFATVLRKAARDYRDEAQRNRERANRSDSCS